MCACKLVVYNYYLVHKLVCKNLKMQNLSLLILHLNKLITALILIPLQQRKVVKCKKVVIIKEN